MFIVKLKNGDTVRVSLEKLEEFLDKNREKIEIQHKTMRARHISPAPVEKPQKTIFKAISLNTQGFSFNREDTNVR